MTECFEKNKVEEEMKVAVSSSFYDALCINPLDSSCSAELVENPVMTRALSTRVGRFELELRLSFQR